MTCSSFQGTVRRNSVLGVQEYEYVLRDVRPGFVTPFGFSTAPDCNENVGIPPKRRMWRVGYLSLDKKN